MSEPRKNGSERDGGAGLYDSDPVIGEFEVGSGDLCSCHMTFDAVPRCDLAGRRGACRRGVVERREMAPGGPSAAGAVT